MLPRHAAALALLLASCGGDDDQPASASADPSCAGSPWSCGAGKTCWPSDDTSDQAVAFACLPSLSSAKAGDACANTVGKPTCGDGLACYQASGDDAGVCAPFCGTGHSCSSGACTPVGYVTGAASSYSICLANPGSAGAGGQESP